MIPGVHPNESLRMAVQLATRPRTSFGVDRAAVGRVGGITAGSVLLVTGLGFIGLGAAFPMAMSIVAGAAGGTPPDLEIATRIAPFWWVLVLVGVLNLVAAFAAPDGRGRTSGFAIIVAGTGAGLTVIAAMTATGPAVVATSVLAAAYVAALTGTVLVPRPER